MFAGNLLSKLLVFGALSFSSATAEWTVTESILRSDPGVYGYVEEFHYFYDQWPCVCSTASMIDPPDYMP
jgi:hypothetical protein